MKKMKKGFTLAEVLISLTIIGVIAAITIPALIQRTNKQEYVSALQKAYSTLSQAANMIIAENGSPKCNDEGWACSAEDVYNHFKKYLNNAKECVSAGTGCIVNGLYKTLDGGNRNLNFDNSKGFTLVLSDGAQVIFDSSYVDKDCAVTHHGTKKSCAQIFVDVNGAKKPNMEGRDGFWLQLTERGLYPAGCDTDICSAADSLSSQGCACKVLTEGAMNY